jgi:hypothetical protein
VAVADIRPERVERAPVFFFINEGRGRGWSIEDGEGEDEWKGMERRWTVKEGVYAAAMKLGLVQTLSRV